MTSRARRPRLSGDMRGRTQTTGVWVCLAGLILGVGGCRHAGIAGLPDPDPIHQGRELTRKGKAPDAYAHFQRLLKQRPDDLAVHRGLVEAAYYAGRLSDVRGFYQELLARPAKEGLGHYGMALVAVAEGPGHMEEALAALARAGERWPKEADVPYRVGLLYLMNGEHEKARQALAQALEGAEQERERVVAYVLAK